MSSSVLLSSTFLLLMIVLCNGQNSTKYCTKNWCGMKWKKIDRIQLFNYTEILENVTFERNITYTMKECNPIDILLSPNTDGCKTINVTETETIDFQVPTYKRDTKPEIRELPRELTLGLIVSENIDIFGNTSTDSYDELQDKVWQIWVPRGCRLVIFFSEFDLESSPNCSKDYLSIQTHKNQTPIPKYCGGISSLPREIRVDKARRTQLHFHSDESNTRRGIHATFCFQKSKDISKDDISCTCNTDTSGIKKRHAEHSLRGQRSRSKSHSKSKSQRSKKFRISRKKMREMMKQQDKVAGACLLDMMKNGLKAINKYRYSSHKEMRVLAEKYQQALDQSLV